MWVSRGMESGGVVVWFFWFVWLTTACLPQISRIPQIMFLLSDI